MKASVYMQGKRIKMLDIKDRFGLWEERRGERRKTFPPRMSAKQKKSKKKEDGLEKREEQEF